MEYEEILINFSESINYLMTINDLNATSLSKKSNVARTAILRYIHQIGLPSLATSVKLADVFECSLDFLFGLTDIPNFYKSNAKINFFKSLKRLMKVNNIKMSNLALQCNFESSNFAKWEKGSYPSVDHLITIAKFFCCSLENLIGRESFE